MRTSYIILLFALFSMTTNFAQVGVGTTNPEATLDIRSSNQNAPTNADGILIPKINNFTTINPRAAEDGTTKIYLGVNYGPLTFIMVNAIKEQAKEIERVDLANRSTSK